MIKKIITLKNLYTLIKSKFIEIKADNADSELKQLDFETGIYRKLSEDAEDTTPIRITKYHTMAYYPFLLFEYEVALENEQKVYCNFNIKFDTEKKGIPIHFQEDMEYWMYSIPLDDVTDDSSYIYLDNETSRKILKKGVALWNSFLSWHENWTTLKS